MDINKNKLNENELNSLKDGSKIYKNLSVRVLIYTLPNDTLEKDFVLHLNGGESRKKLMSCIVWAAFNNRCIEILNIEDDNGNRTVKPDAANAKR